MALLLTWTQQPERKKMARWLLDWRSAGDYPAVLGGASPRGLLKLIRAIHVEAFLDGEFDHGVPNPSWEQVAKVAPDVLRHRIRLSSAPSAASANAAGFIQGLVEWLDDDAQ